MKNITYNNLDDLLQEYKAGSLTDLAEKFKNLTKYEVSTKSMDNQIVFSLNVSNNVFVANPLSFPFTDQKMVETWEWLENLANSVSEQNNRLN